MSDKQCPEGWVEIASGMWTPGPDRPSQRPEYWIAKFPIARCVDGVVIKNEREMMKLSEELRLFAVKDEDVLRWSERIKSLEEANDRVQNGMIHWRERCGEYSADNTRLEAENAELREKLSAAETERQECIEIIAQSDAELARLKSQWVEKVSTVEEVMSTVVSGDDILIDVDLFHRLRRDSRELKELKSQADAGQWAVTSSKLSGESEARSIAQLLNCHPDTANDYKAVPLHAPADGPWVLEKTQEGEKYYSWSRGISVSGKYGIRGAKRFGSKLEAHIQAASLLGDYRPVRLADVEREGE